MEPVVIAIPLAAAAVLCAGLQVVLARWRDLGPWTVGAGGCSLLVSLPDPGVEVLGAIVVAAVLAGAAWARGGRRGVGRPALDGLVLAGAVAASAALPLLSGRVPLPPASLQAALAGSLGLLTVIAGGLALQAPRVGVPPPRWLGSVRVD